MQKKNKHRYNIFLQRDNEVKDFYGFSVEEESLITFDLRKGKQLTNAELEQLQQFDTIQKYYARAIQYLGYRMRTEQEIRLYLEKQEVDEEHIEAIIDRLIDEKILDDGQFASAFVSMRINSSAKGPKIVQRELAEKGVKQSIAQEATKAFTFDVQYEKAQKVVKKRFNRRSRNSFQKELQQLQAYLMRNGYDSSVVREVVSELKRENPEVDETAAVTYQGEKALRRLERKYEGYDLRNRLKQTLYRQGFSGQVIDDFIDTHLIETRE